MEGKVFQSDQVVYHIFAQRQRSESGRLISAEAFIIHHWVNVTGPRPSCHDIDLFLRSAGEEIV